VTMGSAMGARSFAVSIVMFVLPCGVVAQAAFGRRASRIASDA